MPCGAHTATHAPPTQTQDMSETHTLPLELRHVRAPYETQPPRRQVAECSYHYKLANMATKNPRNA
eukprot:3456687-Alexandrium_andersonii.AAC.1